MVEMIYEGPESDIENTFCLIGKGVTFDSGGIRFQVFKSYSFPIGRNIYL